MSSGRMWLDLLVRSVRPWISRASGWQTERADCNYVFEKITFMDNYFNKDKSVQE